MDQDASSVRQRLRRLIEQRADDIERRWLDRVQRDVVKQPGVELTLLRDGMPDYLLELTKALGNGVEPLDGRVSQRCPECGGSGRDWLFPCLACGQQGTVEDEAIVGLRIPPMVRAGSILEVHLQGLGDENFCLRVHVSVEPHAMNERS